jgi:mannosyltransferase
MGRWLDPVLPGQDPIPTYSPLVLATGERGMVTADERGATRLVAPYLASLFVMAFELVRGTSDSMWMDESVSVWYAKKPLVSLIGLVWSRDANMGQYCLALWFWARLDDGDLWIRALSALGTVAAVWGIWLVVRRWSGDRVAAVAVAVFALTPFVLGWSMQARGYSMAMAFTAWSLVFADRIVEQKGRWSGPLFGVTVGLAVATQISTLVVFVGVVLAVFALAPTWRTARSLASAGLAAAGVFAPFAWAVISNPGQVSWIPDLTIDRFSLVMLDASSGGFWALMIASGWVCLMVASIRFVRFRPYLMALAGSASGVVGLVLISVAVTPMFVPRYLIGCIPLAVVAAAGGWSAVWPRRWSIVAVAIVGIFILNLGISLDRTRPQNEGYRAAAAVVMDLIQPGDAIVATAVYPILGLTRYLPDGTPTQGLFASRESPGSWVVVDQDGNEFQTNRIWILYRGPAESARFGVWIQQRFPVVAVDEEFGGIRLQLRETSGG